MDLNYPARESGIFPNIWNSAKKQHIPRKKTSIQRQDEYINKYAPPQPNPIQFEVGEYVFTRRGRREKDPFAPLWQGPFRITSRVTTEIYEVQRVGHRTHYHVDSLRRVPPGNSQAEHTDSTDPDSEDDESQVPGTPATSEPSSSPTRMPAPTAIPPRRVPPVRRRRRCRVVTVDPSNGSSE